MRARIRTQRIARSNRHQLASITFLPALITGWCSTAACSAPAGPNAGTGHQPKISRGERTLCASTLLPITAEGRVMLPVPRTAPPSRFSMQIDIAPLNATFE